MWTLKICLKSHFFENLWSEDVLRNIVIYTILENTVYPKYQNKVDHL